MDIPTLPIFTPVTPETAGPDAAPLLDAAKAKIGMVPNMYANMANFAPLLDTYTHGYDLFREKSGFNPVEQEVVFLTISHENACEYCMAAHSFVAHKMSMVPAEVTDAIRDGAAIADPQLAALSTFVRTVVRQRGRVDAADVAPFLEAGYSQNQLLAVTLAVAVKTLSNYSNHLLGTEVDATFADFTWTAK